MDLQAIGLNEWPFHVVPTPESARRFCGRPRLLGQLREIQNAYQARSATLTNLMWSSVGAGKSHALFWLQNQLRAQGLTACYVIEVPERLRGFAELFFVIVEAIGIEVVLEAFADDPTEFRLSPILEQLCRAAFAFPNGVQALRAYIGGYGDASTARLLGVRGGLTPEHALSSLIVIARALARRQGGRFILCLDEFQRVTHARAPINREVQGSICSLLNRMPDSLGLILSFASPPSASTPDWIDPSLASRAGRQQFVPILPMGRDEARTFLLELLTSVALDAEAARRLFEPGALDAVLDLSGRDRILPRDLISNADYILSRAIAAGTLPVRASDCRVDL